MNPANEEILAKAKELRAMRDSIDMSNKMEVDILANNLLNSQLEITEELERLQRKVEELEEQRHIWNTAEDANIELTKNVAHLQEMVRFYEQNRITDKTDE